MVAGEKGGHGCGDMARYREDGVGSHRRRCGEPETHRCRLGGQVVVVEVVGKRKEGERRVPERDYLPVGPTASLANWCPHAALARVLGLTHDAQSRRGVDAHAEAQ